MTRIHIAPFTMPSLKTRFKLLLLSTLLVMGHTAHAGLFDATYGRWNGDIKLTATNRGTTGKDSVLSGTTYGQVNREGVLRFSLPNGCQLHGTSQPDNFNVSRFPVAVKVSDCDSKVFNDSYKGAITMDGRTMSLTMTTTRVFMVGSDALLVTSKMSRY
ncbi:hypothetical protein [Rhodoferax antarcticus]|uniref:hypothetical protein n=1 Tax=Rhodoferax antarcticus TaxID=81479 RepID=UPI0011151E86|nr:hypothetical protein [Rhodoferax antarcticus]